MADVRGPTTPSAEKVYAVRKAILDDEKRLLNDWPLLGNQDAIGLSIFIVSITVVILTIWMYATERVSFPVTLVSVALATSFLHELEHDLIHQLYFRKSAFIQVNLH